MLTLVEGRRNLPGVKRRVNELTFKPAKGRNFFVEVPQANVFAEREEVQPLGGDPVRWAVQDAAGLHVHSFVILGDGRYELQTYSRKRTDSGIVLHYERVVDGKLLSHDRRSGRQGRIAPRSGRELERPDGASGVAEKPASRLTPLKARPPSRGKNGVHV